MEELFESGLIDLNAARVECSTQKSPTVISFVVVCEDIKVRLDEWLRSDNRITFISGETVELSGQFCHEKTQANANGVLHLTPCFPVEGEDRRFAAYQIRPSDRRTEHFGTGSTQTAMARLACVGSLGSSLAHALNNPLAAINGFSDMMIRRKLEEEKIQRYSTKIKENGERMRIVVQELRSLSSRQLTGSSSQFFLSRIFQTVQTLCSDQFLTRKIDLDLPEVSESVSVKLNELAFRDLVFGLLVFARESFSAAPKSEIRFARIEVDFSSSSQLSLKFSTSCKRVSHFQSLSKHDTMPLEGSIEENAVAPFFLVQASVRDLRAQVEISPVEDHVLMEIVMPVAACETQDDQAFEPLRSAQ